MPASSKSQQRLFGQVRAYQEGKIEDASPEVKKIAEGISEEDAHDFAATKHDGLPERVDDKKKRKAKVLKSLIDTLRNTMGE